MRSLPNQTGGHLVLSDSFTTSIFKQSLMRLFSTDDAGNLEMAFNATLDVKTTKELKVSGLIGHLHMSVKLKLGWEGHRLGRWPG
jgi:protein transport protein SEC23